MNTHRILVAAAMALALLVAPSRPGLSDSQRIDEALALLQPLATPGRLNSSGVTNLRHISTRLGTLRSQLTNPDFIEEPVEPVEPVEPDPVVPPARPVVHVAAGGDVQAALNAAQPGTIITLDPGAVYTGTLTLPLRDCGPDPITLTTAKTGLLATGHRVTPADSGRFAVLSSGSVLPAIRFAEGTCGWEILGLEFLANKDGQHEVIEVGMAWATKTLEGLPRNVMISHVLMRFPGPQKRAIGCNGINVTVKDSHITGAWLPNTDSQAIACWNTPGPITIVNNWLEAGAEVIMFGGADPGVTNTVVADVLVEGNILTRPVAWMAGPVSQYVVKNLFEIKAGRRIIVRGNLMFHHWQAAQPGWAVVFTPRNQSGRCTECAVEDVLFERNVVSSTGGGINITARDDLHPSGQTRRVIIQDNFFDIDHRVWLGPGRFLLKQGDVVGLHILHNTIRQTGNSFMQALGAAAPEFRLVGNLIWDPGQYGFFSTGSDGQNHAHGLRWQEQFPDGDLAGNAFVNWQGNATSRANLPGNLFVSADAGAWIDADGYGRGTLEGYGRR
jgi:hypothetical protein